MFFIFTKVSFILNILSKLYTANYILSFIFKIQEGKKTDLDKLVYINIDVHCIYMYTVHLSPVKPQNTGFETQLFRTVRGNVLNAGHS